MPMDRRPRLTEAECEKIRVEAGNVKRIFPSNVTSNITPCGEEIIRRLARKYNISAPMISKVIRRTYRPQEDYYEDYLKYHNYDAWYSASIHG
jgi:hypothetical protein